MLTIRVPIKPYIFWIKIMLAIQKWQSNEHNFKEKDDYKDEDKEKDNNKDTKKITETLNSVL